MYLLLFATSLLSLRTVLAYNTVECGVGSLPCDNGKECVKSEQWCDKENNCADESDEKYCKTAGWWKNDPNECKGSDSHFLCLSGICVPMIARCNDNDDCKDFTDELECNSDSTTDTSTTFGYKYDFSTKKQTVPESDSESESSSEEDKTTFDEHEDSEIQTTPLPPIISPYEILAHTPPPVHVPHSLSSTTNDFYDKRREEADNRRKTSVTAPTIPQIRRTPQYRTTHDMFSTPQVRQYNYTRHTINYSTTTVTTSSPAQGVRPSTYGGQSHTYNRPSTNDRRPTSYDTRPSTYNPRAYDRHPHTYDGRQPTYGSHTYDRHVPTYDRHVPTYDRHVPTYDRHVPTYDSRTPTQHSRHPDSYNNRLNNYNSQQQHYDGHRQTYDGRQSIFANRPLPNRPSSSNYDNRRHSLNGEPDWREAASLRPYRRETQVNKPFHFAKDYSAKFGRDNDLHLRETQNWLLRHRRDTGDWGKDTARALIALGLVNNSFSSGNSDSELMKRNFMIQLGVDLIRNETTFSINQMATAMNALLSVCENPRDFHGMDLSESLRVKMRKRIRDRAYINPFVYLSLCLSGKELASSEVQLLMKQMQPSGQLHEIVKDTQSMAIQTFACYMQQQQHQRTEDHAYLMSLRETLHNAVANLLQRMNDDGSFGSVYSTALAAQALLSINDSSNWDVEKTMDFIKRQQIEDGSFGDLLATYFVLPVLSGRSLLHLRNIRCKQPAVIRDLTPSEILEFVGPKLYIHYSIYFGEPLENSHSVRVLVPQGISFFDVMRVAEYQDNNFRFVYDEKEKNTQVHSISGVPNDFERGFAWHLYKKQESDPNQQQLHTGERYTGNTREFFPTADHHVIFWYHPIGIRSE